MATSRSNIRFPEEYEPLVTRVRIEAATTRAKIYEVTAEALERHLDAVAVARGHGLEPADVFAALDRYLRFATKAGAKDRAAVERIIAATLEAEDERTAGEAAAAERKLRDRSA